jgi:hypothetical protein
MVARVCNVSFTDYRGTRHTVEVAAESLYEAAVLGLNQLKKNDWIEGIGPATRLEVEVRGPVERHQLTVQQIQRWCEGTAVNPEERLKKDRLKAMLT